MGCRNCSHSQSDGQEHASASRRMRYRVCVTKLRRKVNSFVKESTYMAKTFRKQHTHAITRGKPPTDEQYDIFARTEQALGEKKNTGRGMGMVILNMQPLKKMAPLSSQSYLVVEGMPALRKKTQAQITPESLKKKRKTPGHRNRLFFNRFNSPPAISELARERAHASRGPLTWPPTTKRIDRQKKKELSDKPHFQEPYFMFGTHLRTQPETDANR